MSSTTSTLTVRRDPRWSIAVVYLFSLCLFSKFAEPMIRSSGQWSTVAMAIGISWFQSSTDARDAAFGLECRMKLNLSLVPDGASLASLTSQDEQTDNAFTIAEPEMHLVLRSRSTHWSDTS